MNAGNKLSHPTASHEGRRGRVNRALMTVSWRYPGRPPTARLEASTRLLLGQQYCLKAVILPHAPMPPLSTYRRFFGAAVIANPERAALHPDSAAWPTTLQGGNPALRQITEDHLSSTSACPVSI